MSYEEVGLRLRTDGVVEAGNGVGLLATALDQVASRAGVAAGPLQSAGAAVSGLSGGAMVAVGAVTALGTAAAVAAAAAYQGAKEHQTFERALLLSGNAAGVAAGELRDMARGVDAVVGTQAQAVNVLAQLVGGAEVSRAQLQLTTEAAISLERSLGVAVQDTVRDFNALGKDPVKAAARLNEAHNFLTLGVWAQIRALGEQGRTAEAAAVAQEAYAKSAIARSKEMDTHLGTLQKAWRGVKETAAEAWDAMLGIGRQATTRQQIDSIDAQIKALDSRKSENPQLTEQRRAALIERKEALQEVLRLETKVADVEGTRAAAVRSQVAADLKKERGGGGRGSAKRDIPGAIDDSSAYYKQQFLRSEKEAYDGIDAALAKVAERERKRFEDQERSMATWLAAQEADALLAKQRAEQLDAEIARWEKIDSHRSQTDANIARTDAIAESIYQGVANGWRDGERPSEMFLRNLKEQFARTILRVPIQFMAQAQQSFINSIVGAASGLFSGSGAWGGNTASPIESGMKNIESVGGTAGGGSTVLSYSPVINIDSRTDRAEVAALVQQQSRASQAELLDMLDRRAA